jgi:hypothetical protein
MRCGVFVPLLIVLAVLYVCDVEYNRGAISDGIISMGRSAQRWALAVAFRTGLICPIKGKFGLPLRVDCD